MHRGSLANLGNIVLSFSDAMDLASPVIANHQQRTAFVVWEMAKKANFSEDAVARCFIAALLHDIGALSVEEKIELINNEVANTEDHCIRGERILKNVPWLEDAAKTIRVHHKKWEDWEEPIETPLVMESQLLHIADYLERLIDRDKYILHQNEDIISKLNDLSGSHFHPQVVKLLTTTANREEFWLDLVSPRLYSMLLHEGPYKKVEIELPKLIIIAELFRNIIDFRSRFTATHSSGVAAAASMLADKFGLTDTEVGLMEVAGSLHDLGKLVIPNDILDKPGKLTKEEAAVMRSHTYYTYSILNTIDGFQQIAEWAAYHHEKLDGSGYPFHCKADELSTGARILMVADLYTALAEDRPYRKGMLKDEVVRIIKQFADRELIDARIVKVLFDNYEEIHSFVVEKQMLAKDFYENQFAMITK